MKKILAIIIFTSIFFFSWNFVAVEKTSQNSTRIFVLAPQKTSLSAKAFVPGIPSNLTKSLSTRTPSNDWMQQLYKFSRGLLNLGLFAFLVYIAIRNILNLNVDTYGIKKMLPKLVFAAFLGNLILPIFAIGSGIIDQLQTISIFEPRVYDWMWLVNKLPTSITGVAGLVGLVTLVPRLATLGTVSLMLAFIMLIVVFLLIVCCLLISLFLALRPWVILLGVAVGPIAIACLVLPETEAIFKRWLKIIVFWLLYPLIIYAIRYIATIVPTLPGSLEGGALYSVIGFILPLIIKIGLFGLVVRAPFTWEKDVGGIVASIPQSVVKGYQTVDRTNRMIYGYVGTAAYQKYRKEGRKAFDQGIKQNRANIQNDANTHLQTDEGKANIKTKAVDLYRTGISKHQKTLDALGGKLPKLDELIARYDQWRDRDPDMIGPNASRENKALAKYFEDHEAEIEPRAKKEYESEYKAKKSLEYGQKSEFAWQKGLRGKYLMFGQKHLPSGISTYLAAHKENFAKDTMKMEFRFNEPVQFLARYVGPEAYIKNHVERKKGDHQPLDEEGLETDMGKKGEWEAKIYGESVGITDESDARALHAAMLRKLFDNQETTAVYSQTFFGKKGTVKDYDGRDVTKTIDGDVLGSNISAYEKGRTLAASAARSTRNIEEQKYLREQQQNRFWQNTGRGASAAITARTATGIPISSMAQAPITPAERKIIQGIDELRNTIESTTGPNLLNLVNRNFGDRSYDDVTPEHFANLYYDAKADGSSLRQKLLDLAGDDPAKQQRANDFSDELEASNGWEPNIFIQRARQEFGESPQVKKLIVDYSAKSVMQEIVTRQNPEARALQQRAEGLAGRCAQDSTLLPQIKQAIDTCLKDLDGDRSLPPQQVSQAKNLVAHQFGLSDPNTVTRGIIRSISQEVNVMSTRNPEVE